MSSDPPAETFLADRWRRLCKAHIPDLGRLKYAAPGSVFVVLDAQPWGWDSSRPAEIGLTLMRCPPITHILPRVLPKKLEELGVISDRQTFGIRVADRRRLEKNSKPPRFGERYAASPGSVEELLLTFLEIFLGRGSTPPHLILVSFGITFELQLLERHYRRLRQRLSAWVDLQDIARQLASGHEGKRVTNPSLSEALLACDFPSEARSCLGPRRKDNAAADTVRMSWLLLHMLCLPINATPDIKRSPRGSNSVRNSRPRRALMPPARTSFDGRCPRPDQCSAFMVRVYRRSGDRAIIPQDLHAMLSGYNATYSGIYGGGAYVWAAFPDEETLDRFVASTRRSTLTNDHMWVTFEIKEPEMIPPKSLQELRECAERRRVDKAEKKRSVKWPKKGGQDDDTGAEEAADEDGGFYLLLI